MSVNGMREWTRCAFVLACAATVVVALLLKTSPQYPEQVVDSVNSLGFERSDLEALDILRARLQACVLTGDAHPSLVFHGILALGPDLVIRDKPGGADVPHGRAVEGYFQRVCDRVAGDAVSEEVHPSQYTAYLLLGEPDLGRALLQDSSSAFAQAWREELRVYNETVDSAWFAVAYALAGDPRPYTNKFAETINSDYVANVVLRQSRTQVCRQPCLGGHSLHALAILLDRFPEKLRPSMRASVADELQRRVHAAFACVDEDGHFRVAEYVALSTCDDDTYLLIVGHLLESVAACGTTVGARCDRLRAFAREVLRACESSMLAVEDATNRATAPPLSAYVAVTHAVRGLSVLARPSAR